MFENEKRKREREREKEQKTNIDAHKQGLERERVQFQVSVCGQA